MTSTPGRVHFRTFLTVSQVALALKLTIGAGLMMRSFLRLVTVDPAFDEDGVLTLELSFPEYLRGQRFRANHVSYCIGAARTRRPRRDLCARLASGTSRPREYFAG